MRDYAAMRWVLAIVAEAGCPLGVGDFRRVGPDEVVDVELVRLEHDGLIDSDVDFGSGYVRGGNVRGLTREGREFFNLIQNDEVWAIVSETLGKARIDVSYPLLKEVCEEIVKRYVTSFIPEL